MIRLRIFALISAGVAVLCLLGVRPTQTQSTLRRITNTTEEGININPSISGDGRVVAFESTEDIAGAGGTDHFRAIRANIAVDPATFFQMGGTRAVAPAISQDGSRIAFASKDDPLGTNLDGNSEIFLFDGARLSQVTNTSPGDIANRVTNGNFQPSISDDGRFIAFSSNRDLAGQNADGNLEIFIYDTVATTFAQLTSSSGIVGASDAKISGNGAKVAFVRDAGATPSVRRDLMIQDRTSGPATVIASQVQTLLMTYGRAISDDGTRVVYSGETATNASQVFLFDGRGGNSTRQITSLGTRVTEVPLHATISGDGTRIAFATRRNFNSFNSDGSVELYVHDVPSATFARITTAPSTATADVVSSLNDDGSIVAFSFPRVLSGAVNDSSTANNSEIYVTATPARPAFGALTVVNGASFGTEPSTTKAVAPDSIAVAHGGALANTTLQPQRLPNGTFPTSVGGTTVTVNGRAAQIFFVSPGQVNFLVPPATEIGTADVVITNSEGFQSRGSVPTLRAAPGVFTKPGDGTGEGMVLNSDTLQSGPFDPTGGNLHLTIFATGARNATQTFVVMGGRVVNADAVMASADMPGLDEVHVSVPADLRGAGTVDLFLQSDGRASNTASITFVGDGNRDILVNEVLADPPGSAATDLQGDANHDGVRSSNDDEFIELVNTTSHDINLSGYQLKTRSSTATSDGLRHTFAAGTILPGCSAIVVFGGGTFDPNNPAFGGAQVVKATSGGLSLTNSGAVITLFDQAAGVVTLFTYGGSTGLNGGASQALTRSPDVTGGFVLHQSAAGSAGRLFSPGTRVDGTPFTPCPPLVRVDVSPASATIFTGAHQQFTAHAFDANNQEVLGVIFTWQSSNTSAATVDANGLATGVGPGSTEIRATGRGVTSAPASLTVQDVARVLTSVTVTPNSATIPATGAQQFTGHGFDQFNNEIAGLTFTWESSNTSAATIDATGLATGISQGQTTIKATSQSISGTATLTVTPPTIVINEALAAPPTGTDGDANHDGVRSAGDDEFVELVNSTGAGINIAGWTVRTHSTSSTTETIRHTFVAGTSVPAGEAMVVFGGGTFSPTDPVFGCAQVVKASSGGLSLTDSGLTILIRDGSGNLVTQFSYGGSTGLNGGNAQSLTRSPDITGNFVQHTTIAGARKFSPGLKVDGTPFGNCPGHPASVTIAPLSTSINVGQTTQFTAQAFDQFGRAMTGVTITFASDNTTVATVDSTSTNPVTGIATGTVGAHNPGTAHITATATDGTTTANSSQATLTVAGPSLTINDVSLNEGNSGPTTFNFTVSLDQPAAAGGVTFNIATQDGTATVADSDYVAGSLTAQTIPAGQQTYNFAVTVNGDLTIEPNESFFVNVTNVTGASIGDGQGLGTIVNDDSPSLSVNDVATNEGNTGTTTFAFTVTSTLPAPAGGISFDIATQDGTATSASGDYVARSLTGQTIPVGQTTYTFNVTVNGDTFVEPDETFFVKISNPSGGGATIAGNGQGTGTIKNDDTTAVVISQVYGGGGNSGAQFKNDFIEVFNRGTSTVDLAGWSVQQASATGTSWSVTALCPIGPCLLAPGKYFLVKEASSGAVGIDLPTPDATGTSNLAATSGKIALVSNMTALTTSGCPFAAAIADFVGYGTTTDCSENSTHAATPSNTTADFRKSGGCIDTNDNAADFVTSGPSPRNSSSPANDCSTGFRPDITINDVSVTEGDTGTKTVDFTVTLSAVNATQTVTVNYATADGTAAAGSDYQSTSGTLTFSPGQTSKPITLTIIGDRTQESNETFFVNLSNAANAVTLDDQGQGTITNDDIPPTLTINDVSQNEGDSGTSTFHFVVSLSAPALTGGVSFDIATQDNTATVANNDYVARTLTSQTIAAGASTYAFDVTVNGDTNIEPNETFFVNVTNISGATILDGQGQGTIQNDDSPVLSINNVSANEGNSGTTTFTFTVTSTLPAPAGGITFDIATADNTATSASGDYVARSLTAQTIPAGQTTYTFDVAVNGDTSPEPDETFFVNISNPAGGGATISGTGQGTGTIQNDDGASVVISQVYGGGGNTSAAYNADFVELFNRSGGAVNITGWSLQNQSATTVGAAAGTNWTAASLCPTGPCTIAAHSYYLVRLTTPGSPGAALPTPDSTPTTSINLSATAGKVALVNNTAVLVSPSGSGCPSSFASVVDFVGYGTGGSGANCFEGSAAATGPASTPTSVTNTTSVFRKSGGCVDTNDNAADFATSGANPRNSASSANDCSTGFRPDISINDPAAATEGDSGTTTLTFNVTLSAPNNSQTVTVSYATADGTATAGLDYQSASGTVTFNPTETTKPIVITINSDLLDEANETFFVNLSNATNAAILDAQGQGTINDNDPTPSLSIDDLTNIPEGDTGTSTATFTVTLSAISGQTVTVNYATADGSANAGSDYVAASGILTFNPGETTKPIPVTINGDTTFEPNETFFVNLTVPVNASISDNQGQGTITNDDVAPPTFDISINDVSVAEGNSGTKTVDFTVSLSNSSTQTVTVDYTTSSASPATATAGTDYVAASGTVTFNPGEISKPITITINGDTRPEPDDTFFVDLTNATNAAITDSRGVGTITNDDGALVVISQVYGGGGNAGATYNSDFVELLNRSDVAVDVTNWSIQYQAATTTTGAAWAVNRVCPTGTCSIAAGHYWLIQLSGGATGAALPTPDASPASPTNLSATAGKIALVNSTTAITGTSGSGCPSSFASVLDLIGYGTGGSGANCFEGAAAAPTISATLADFRKSNSSGGTSGCFDTNNNSTDFATATPLPRNSATAPTTCP